MRNNTQKGFTLIELLVVIAIIGILATVVLSSLSSARLKASDAKIQAQLSSMRAQAQLYTTTATPTGQTAGAITIVSGANPITAANGNLFSDSTAGSNSLTNLIKALPSGVAYAYANTTLPSAGGAWAFAMATNAGASCVDGNGVSKNFVGTPPAVTADFTATGVFPNLASGSCS